MEPTKLTKEIVDFMNLEGQEGIINWISTIKEDIDAAEISQVDISDRKPFRQIILDGKVGQGLKRKRNVTVGLVREEEHIQKHSCRSLMGA